MACAPAPLTFGKASFVVANLQEGEAQAEMRLGIVGPQPDGPFPVRDRLLRLAPPAREEAQAVVNLDALGFGSEHLFHTRVRLAKALGVAKGNAHVEAGV